MAGRKSDFTLPTNTLDELFSTQEERDDAKLSKIRDIPLELIDDFPDHPFKVRDDEDMIQLVESVKERGVITPAMPVRGTGAWSRSACNELRSIQPQGYGLLCCLRRLYALP